MHPKKNTVVIIGAGNVGKTIGYFLQHSGRYRVTALSTRHKATARQAAEFIGGRVKPFTDPALAAREGRIIFVTTLDKAISETCAYLSRAKVFSPDSLVIHCSGNFSSDILESARAQGARVVSFHPLQTFARPLKSRRQFRQIYCTYEGTPSAYRQIKQLIRSLGGIPVRIKRNQKPIYHISGIFVSNYLVSLLWDGIRMLKQAGFPEQAARKAIIPIVENTIENIKSLGPARALTGPIARADYPTIKKHIQHLKLHLPNYLPFYIILGRETVKVALEKRSITRGQARKLNKLLSLL